MAISYQMPIWPHWLWNTGLRCAPQTVILRGFAVCVGLTRFPYPETDKRPRFASFNRAPRTRTPSLGAMAKPATLQAHSQCRQRCRAATRPVPHTIDCYRCQRCLRHLSVLSSLLTSSSCGAVSAHMQLVKALGDGALHIGARFVVRTS